MKTITNKEWWKRAAVRAIKTMAQTALSLFTVGQVAQDIDWGVLASAALVAGVYSMLTSLAGLPEVQDSGNTESSGE